MICFDALHPYYLPQYLPVMHELLKRGESVHFVIYRSKEQQAALEHLVEEYQLSVTWVDNQQQALAYYIDQRPKWVIFGNTLKVTRNLKAFVKQL